MSAEAPSAEAEALGAPAEGQRCQSEPAAADKAGKELLLSPAASWMNVRVESDSRKQWGGGLRFFAFHNRFFNKKSVRGTIVLRWEYVRGSTLFAVWNLSTPDEDARKGISYYSPWRDLRGAFGAPGTNTFAIKLSYWLAP